jgi:hypothetical protein
MHLYLFVRGKFEQVKLWESMAQSAFYKWRRTNLKTGKEEIILVQGALRPSILGAYEYVFPKEALAEVCAFFGISRNESYGFGTIGLNLRHYGLRKLFGCKKIPDDILKKAQTIPNSFSTEEFERACGNCIIPGVSWHVIGIKDDEVRDFTNFGYRQESL